MTTKRRSKPRALYLIFDKYNRWWGQDFTKSQAERWRDKLVKLYPNDAPYEFVKYVREVKRK